MSSYGHAFNLAFGIPYQQPRVLGECAICGEKVDEDHAAEMYDPLHEDVERRSALVHAECGIQQGWVVA